MAVGKTDDFRNQGKKCGRLSLYRLIFLGLNQSENLYKERHVVECMFGKLKYYRRIATRFEKKASHFKEMLAFAAVLSWLR